MISKLMLTLSGVALLAAVTAAPAYARPVPAASPLPASGPRTSIPEICAQSGTGYCLNNWSGLVKMESSGPANNKFTLFPLQGYCNNGLVSTGTGGNNPPPACPFPNGSGLNSRYDGDPIVEIAPSFSGPCIGTDNSEYANVGACPPGDGGTGSNIWVIGPECGTNSYYYINVYWSGQHGNTNASSLISGGAIGAQAYVAGNNPATSCWGQRSS